MSMYDKNHYNIVISLQLIKINEKKKKQHDGNRLPLDTPWWDRPEVTLPHISLPLRTFSWLAICGLPEHRMTQAVVHSPVTAIYTSVCFTWLSGCQSWLYFRIIYRALNTPGTQAPPLSNESTASEGGAHTSRCSPISPRDSNIQPGFRNTSLKEFSESRHMLIHHWC